MRTDTMPSVERVVQALLARGFHEEKPQEPGTRFFMDADGSATIYVAAGLVDIYKNTASAVAFLSSSTGYSLEEVERMTATILADLAKEGTWDEEGLETAQAAYDILKRRLQSQHHTGEQTTKE